MNQHRLRVRTPFHVIAGVQVDHVGSVITLQVKGQPDLRIGPVTASAVGELLLQAARDHSAGAPPTPDNRAMWLERDVRDSRPPEGESPRLAEAAVHNDLRAVSWTRTAGMWLPVAAGAGPHDTASGLARGFARTPAGAVLAAAHIRARTAPWASPHIYKTTIIDQIAPGPAAHELAAHTAAAYQAERARQQARGDGPLTPPGVATVAGGGTQMLTLRMLMRWRHSDWQAAPPPTGDWSTVTKPATRVGDLTLFHR